MEFILDKTDANNVRRISTDLQHRYKTVDNPDFYRRATYYAFDLPKDLLISLSIFNSTDHPFMKIKGLPIHDELLMQTPASWREGRSEEAYLCEFMHYLIAVHIGQPFCWKTQQNGRTVNDILPVKGFEHEQLAIASKSNLMWHVEDAFHDARGEFLSLMCLRNQDKVPTLISAPNMKKLSSSSIEELMKPQYFVRADDAHDQNTNLNEIGGDDTIMGAFEYARSLRKVAILFGSPQYPYMRLDMDTFGRESFVSDEAEAAYRELCDLVETSAAAIVCEPGDILIVNNFLTVHGRPPFQPRYDGKDRWLQRLLINSDFRKAAAYRESVESNILYA